jgi:hypothetical protein
MKGFKNGDLHDTSNVLSLFRTKKNGKAQMRWLQDGENDMRVESEDIGEGEDRASDVKKEKIFQGLWSQRISKIS